MFLHIAHVNIIALGLILFVVYCM